MDCGSRDGTAQVDVDFRNVNMLRLPHHIGAARAWNIATRTSKADLLFFVSPDVEVLPDTPTALANALQQEPDSVAVCPLLTDPSGQPTPRAYRLPDPAGITPDAPKPVACDVASSSAIEYPSFDALMVRKQFVQAMNYFDERYGHYWVDAEFAMQVRRIGKKIRLHPEIRAVYHAAPDPLEGDSLAEADRVAGAAAYAGKYGGSGIGLRMGAAMKALGRFDLGLVGSLIGGSKLDGSQAG